MNNNRNEEVTLNISKDESLILFDLLSRFSDSEKLAVKDHSEEIVLWHVLGKLEKILVEPFENNYLELLEQAKNRVKKDE